MNKACSNGCAEEQRLTYHFLASVREIRKKARYGSWDIDLQYLFHAVMVERKIEIQKIISLWSLNQAGKSFALGDSALQNYLVANRSVRRRLIPMR